MKIAAFFLICCLREVMRVGLRLALIPHDDPPHPPPSPTCSLVSCESYFGGHRDYMSPRSWVPLEHVQACLQEAQRRNTKKNYLVIRSSFTKFVCYICTLS